MRGALVLLVSLLLLASMASAPKIRKYDKINDEVLREFSSKDKVKVIVKLKEGHDFKSSLASQRKKFYSSNGFAAELSADELEKLESSGDVEKVNVDHKVKAFLQDSVSLIGAVSAEPLGINGTRITGEGQSVCVIDTGIDYTHSDLGTCSSAQFLAGNCSKVPAGYDFVNLDSDPADDNSHGTHVSGIIAANGTKRGVAPKARIVSIKALDNNGDGTFSDVISGIDWCVANATKYNITAISMSLGTDSPLLFSSDCDSFDSSTTAAVNAALAKNISVVAASGNSGSTSGISLPACISGVISVASSTKSDTVSGFGNRNSITDLIAPGSSISSTVPGGYATFSGTSMATPHVAGAIALLQQFKKDESNISLTPSQAESALKQTGVGIFDSSTGITFKRIDVFKAMGYVDSIPPALTLIYPPNNTIQKVTSVTVNSSTTEILPSAFLETEFNSTMDTLGNVVSLTLNLIEGYHPFRVIGNDSSGKFGFTETRFITIDYTAPYVSVAIPSNDSLYFSQYVDLNYLTQDAFSIRCFLLNGTFIQLTGCANTTFKALRGPQNITVLVNDTAGNANSTTIFFTVNPPPEISIQSPLNTSYNYVPSLNFTLFDDDLNTTWYFIDDSANMTLAGNTTLSVQDGHHFITVSSNDSLGHFSSVWQEFTTDATKPSLSFANTTPINKTINSTNKVTVHLISSELLANVTLEFNGTNETMAYNSGEWSLDKTLSDGTYIFRAFGADLAGNWNSSQTAYITIDTIRNFTAFFNQLNSSQFPAKLAESGNQANTNNVSLVLNYTIDVLFSGATIKIANFSWLNVNQSAFPNASVPAPVDAVFNSSGGVLSSSAWIDVNGFVSSFDPVVEFDYPYRIFFYLNGSSSSPQAFRIVNECGAPLTRPCFVVGENRSFVYLNSFSGAAAGNDTQRPEIELASPSGTSSSVSISVAYSVTDNVGVSKCFYSLNGLQNTTLISCANVTVTSQQGQNTIVVYANDTSGNMNSVSSTFTVSVPPVTVASSGGSSGGPSGVSSVAPLQRKSDPPKNKTNEIKLCAQVITPASKNGVCHEFPTPCDVPNGWQKVDSCKKTIELKEETPTGQIVANGIGIANVIRFAFVAIAALLGLWKLFLFSSGNRP